MKHHGVAHCTAVQALQGALCSALQQACWCSLVQPRFIHLLYATERLHGVQEQLPEHRLAEAARTISCFCSYPVRVGCKHSGDSLDRSDEFSNIFAAQKRRTHTQHWPLSLNVRRGPRWQLFLIVTSCGQPVGRQLIGESPQSSLESSDCVFAASCRYHPLCQIVMSSVSHRY